MWKFAFALALLVFVWTLVGIFGAPLTVGALGSLCVGVGVASWRILVQARAQRAAIGLSHALRASAGLAKNALEAALDAWQAAQPRRRGATALAQLPWYWLIGPAAAGKSTLLRSAGLNLSSHTRHQPVQGPPNAALWFADEAVVIESGLQAPLTPWLPLLEGLRLHRPRRPLQGVLVGVSATLLLSGDIAAVRQLAHRLRATLDSILHRLGTQPPLYIVVTQCDHIAGFTETFATLAPRERSQPWGALLPWPTAPGQVREACVAHWDDLVASLRMRALSRLAEVRDQRARERIFQFGARFAALRPTLMTLIGELSTPDAARRAPPVRGFLCTASHPSAFFADDLFRRTLAADTRLRPLMVHGAPRQSVSPAFAVATALVCMAIGMLPLWSYYDSRASLLAARDVMQEVAIERASNRNKLIPVVSLERLRLALHALRQASASAPPLAVWTGMQQDDALIPQMHAFYVKMLKDELIAPIAIHDVQQMHNFYQRYEHTWLPPTPADYKLYFDKLKTHLLLTGVCNGRDAASDETSHQWLVSSLVGRWGRALGNANDPAWQAQMGQHIAYYLEYSREHAPSCMNRDEYIVNMTRSVLNRLPWADAWVESIIADADTYAVGLPQVMGDIRTPLHTDVRVRGGFTRRGWENSVRARLDGDLTNPDAWVLGRAAVTAWAQQQVTPEQVRQRYWDSYADAWRVFLLSLRLQTPRDTAQALTLVRDLTSADPPPLRRVMQAVAYNIRIMPDGDAKPAPLDDFVHFVTPLRTNPIGMSVAPIDLYQEQLITLRVALESYVQNPDAEEQVWLALLQATDGVRALLRANDDDDDDDDEKPRFMQGLLASPVEMITESLGQHPLSRSD